MKNLKKSLAVDINKTLLDSFIVIFFIQLRVESEIAIRVNCSTFA